MLIILETSRREADVLAAFDQHVGAQLFSHLCSDDTIMQQLAMSLVNCFTRTAVMEESVTRRVMQTIQIAETEPQAC